jgi:hypothetical protein
MVSAIIGCGHDYISFGLQDLQKGIDLGLVSPEVLQNFFDLEKYPLLSELTHRFQVNLYFENKTLYKIMRLFHHSPSGSS